jgi:hypothetical protein
MSRVYGFRSSESDHGHAAPGDRAALYVAETAFLDHLIRLTTTRTERLEQDENARREADTEGQIASRGGEQLAASYQAARRVLEALRDDPRRVEHGLERLLGDSLREADRRLIQIGSQGQSENGYDDVFWEAEQERNIRAGILRHWWHWLRGDPVGL